MFFVVDKIAGFLIADKDESSLNKDDSDEYGL